jgi:hypothetical protein
MKSVLVIDEGQHLLNTLKMFSRRLSIEARFVSAHNQNEALKVLNSIDVTEVVASTRYQGFDGFALASAAINTALEVKVSFVTDREDLYLGLAEPKSPVRFLKMPIEEDSVLAILSDQPEHTEETRHYLDLLDIVRVFCVSTTRSAVRVFSDQGDGVLGFSDRAVHYARVGHLCGVEAFLQMALWQYSGFEKTEPTDLPPCEPNMSTPLANLMREAIQLRLAMLSGEFPALKLSDIEASIDEELPPAPEPPAEQKRTPNTAREEIEQWWRHIAMTRLTGLRLVMGHSPDVSCSCAHILSEKLSHDLDGTKTWFTDSGQGPSFIRIHPKGGGELNLTVVPMNGKNAFAFESFSRSADAVLICPRKLDDSLEDWKRRVPFRVKCVVINGGNNAGKHRCTALDALIREIE